MFLLIDYKLWAVASTQIVIPDYGVWKQDMSLELPSKLELRKAIETLF